MNDWMTVVHWLGALIVSIAVNMPLEVPPPIDACIAVPLVVTVTSWPKNKGKGRTGGAWNSTQTLAVANFLWNPQRFEAVDDRGCEVTIVR